MFHNILNRYMNVITDNFEARNMAAPEENIFIILKFKNLQIACLIYL